jgi:hypothetical protein
MRRTFPLIPILALAAAAAPAAPGGLTLRASPAVAPCATAAALAYEKATGRSLLVETAPLEGAASADGADLVIGADAELHRIIESGASHPDLDLDVARIPWVLVGPAGAAAADLRALEREGGRVLVPAGALGRQARRGLGSAAGGSLPADFALARLRPGEAAVVPLSLAPPGPVSATAIPPFVARALGVRASPRAEAARAFLEFLAGEAGSAAFGGCGRPEAP